MLLDEKRNTKLKQPVVHERMSYTFETVPGTLSAGFKDAKFKRIDIDSDITQELASNVVKQVQEFVARCARFRSVHRSPREPDAILFVFINSRGGSLHGALRICDALQRAADYCVVATVISAHAYSAAATIALCGTKGYRFVVDNAIMLIHHAVLAGPSRASGLENKRHVHRAQAAADAIILNAVCPTMRRAFLAQRARERNRDWYLYTPDLLRYGLADCCDVPGLVFHVEYRPRLVLRRQTRLQGEPQQ